MQVPYIAYEEVVPTEVVRLPHHLSSAAVVRRRVREDLGAHGIPPTVTADVALVLSELVGNSVRHASPLAGGEVEVSWHMVADGVKLRVTDGGGEVMPKKLLVGVDEERGRGLSIVAMLAAAWGVESTAIGRTVWAQITSGGLRRSGGVRLAESCRK